MILLTSDFATVTMVHIALVRLLVIAIICFIVGVLIGLIF